MLNLLYAMVPLASVFSADPFLAQEEEFSFDRYDNPLAYEKPVKKKEAATTSQETASYRSFFQVGGNYTHVNFRPGGHSDSNGNLGGMQGSYEYFSESCFYAGIKLNWRQGNTGGGHSLLYVDTQEVMGYSVHWSEVDSIWTFFSGLGFRHLGLGSRAESDASFGYNTFYVPVGLAMDYVVNSWFAFHLNLTWMPQIFPSVWIDPLRGTNWSLTKKFANFMVEAPFDFSVTDDGRWRVIVSPFYEYWQDGHSTARTETGLTLGLSENTFKFYGVNVNVGYYF